MSAVFSLPPARPRVSREAIWLLALWLFIGLVAAYDIYLTIKYQHNMRWQEKNWLGLWLMRLDDGGVGIFLGCKFLGTMLAWGLTQAVYWYHARIALASSVGVAALQGALGVYLLFG